MRERQQIAGPRAGPVVQVQGPGSILNDQRWTPLVNDSFILGGVHTKQDFHWAEEEFDRFSTENAQKFLKLSCQEKWKRYILEHSNFWAGGYARVFARELIGLKTFGYTAVFETVELGFTPGICKVPMTFESYLNALKAVQFRRNDRSSINSALSELLFGKSDELSNLSDGKQ